MGKKECSGRVDKRMSQACFFGAENCARVGEEFIMVGG
jgi:hypothetical protein